MTRKYSLYYRGGRELALAGVGEICAGIEVDKENGLEPAYAMKKNCFLRGIRRPEYWQNLEKPKFVR